MSITAVMLLVFLLNLPFGYMRSGTEPFSMRWLLAVHIPVPFVFLLREFSGYSWKIIPLLVLAFAAGQLLGGKLGKFNIRS